MLFLPENVALVLGGIVGGAVLAAILLFVLLAYLQRRRHAKQLQLMELFQGYFAGQMSADQIGQRVRQTAGHYFLRDWELFTLVTAAFQRVVDLELLPQAHSEDEERRLMRRLAALKTEFGLADRYQIEGWRPGRE